MSLRITAGVPLPGAAPLESSRPVWLAFETTTLGGAPAQSLMSGTGLLSLSIGPTFWVLWVAASFPPIFIALPQGKTDGPHEQNGSPSGEDAHFDPDPWFRIDWQEVQDQQDRCEDQHVPRETAKPSLLLQTRG